MANPSLHAALGAVLSCALLGACKDDDPQLRWDIAFESRSLATRAALIEARIVEGDCLSEDNVYVSAFAPDEAGEVPPDLDRGKYAFIARAQDDDCYWYAQGCTALDLPRGGEVMVRLSPVPAEVVDCDGACRCAPLDAGPRDSGAAGQPAMDAGGREGGAGEAGPEDDAMVPEIDSGPPPAPVMLEFEAESAEPLHAPFSRLDDPMASGGIYVSYPYDPEQPMSEWLALKRATPPADDATDGIAIYEFEVPRTGEYRLWGRVITATLDEDSFWLRIDGGGWIQWNDIDHVTGWHWADVRPFEQRTERYVISLEGGPHTLTISYRELGAKLDKLLLSSDLGYIPPDSL